MTRSEIDSALLDSLASYAMELQRALERYVARDVCRCPQRCERCDALALLHEEI